jgi:hypothetical protein
LLRDLALNTNAGSLPIAEFSANLPDQLSYIRIIGDDHRRIKPFVEGVDQQPRRKIDVRAPLLDFDDLHQRRRRWRGRNRMQWQLHRVAGLAQYMGVGRHLGGNPAASFVILALMGRIVIRATKRTRDPQLCDRGSPCILAVGIKVAGLGLILLKIAR